MIISTFASNENELRSYDSIKSFAMAIGMTEQEIKNSQAIIAEKSLSIESRKSIVL